MESRRAENNNNIERVKKGLWMGTMLLTGTRGARSTAHWPPKLTKADHVEPLAEVESITITHGRSRTDGLTMSSPSLLLLFGFI